MMLHIGEATRSFVTTNGEKKEYTVVFGMNEKTGSFFRWGGKNNQKWIPANTVAVMNEILEFGRFDHFTR